MEEKPQRRKKPSFVQPIRQKKQVYASRQRYVDVRRRKDYITIDEINQLKNRKHIIEQQKKELIARIGRYEFARFHTPTDSQNKQIATSVEQQVQAWRKMIAERKKQIEEVASSDLAATVTEIQEESKIMHLELVRLQEQKHNLQEELKDAQNKLDDFLYLYTPRQIYLKDKELKEYKAVVKKKERAVYVLEHPEAGNKSYKLLQEHQQQEEEYRKKLLKKIRKEKKEIRKENRAIEKLQKKAYKYQYI